MFVIGVSDKPMKMPKKVFWPLFALNIEYERNFKVGCPPVNGGSKGHNPLATYASCYFSSLYDLTYTMYAGSMFKVLMFVGSLRNFADKQTDRTITVTLCSAYADEDG